MPTCITSQPSQTSQPHSQQRGSEASPTFGGGTPLSAMASCHRSSCEQDGLEHAAASGSGDDEQLLNTSERQELSEHDDDESSLAFLKV